MSRDALELERARPQARHEVVLQEALLFGEHGGELLVVGVPPPAVLLAAACSTDRLTLIGRGRAAREARRWIETLTPCAVELADRDGSGMPLVEGPFGAALVWDLPKQDPIDVLERALVTVADGGRILVSVARRGREDQRIERLVSGFCDERLEALPGAPLERVVLSGVRRAPFAAEWEGEEPDPLPLTVVVRHTEDVVRTERLLIDLLLRQVFPPHRVLVLDDAARVADQLPEDLWGHPGRSPAEVALVTEGAGRTAGAAWNDALGAVETPFVVFLEGGERLAPLHLVTLGFHLESSGAPAVICDHLQYTSDPGGARFVGAPHRDPERLMRALLAGRTPPLAASVWRVDALRELDGFDPELDRGAVVDMWLRVVEKAVVPVLPIPLCALVESFAKPVSEGDSWVLASERVSLARWSREFPDRERDARPDAVNLALARVLLRGGEAGGACDRLAASEADLAGDFGCVLALAAARAGRDELLREAVEASRDDRSGLFTRAIAAWHEGREEDVHRWSGAWCDRHPGDRVAALARLALCAPAGLLEQTPLALILGGETSDDDVLADVVRVLDGGV